MNKMETFGAVRYCPEVRQSPRYSSSTCVFALPIQGDRIPTAARPQPPRVSGCFSAHPVNPLHFRVIAPHTSTRNPPGWTFPKPRAAPERDRQPSSGKE